MSGSYDAVKAQSKAAVRRKQAKIQLKRLVTDKKLEKFVVKALLKGKSPGSIAGRLKSGREPGLPYVCRDSIERYLVSTHGTQLAYKLKCLKQEQGRKKCRKKPSSDSRMKQRGDPKTYIDDRPTGITNRERVGDMEVDFIVSGKGGHGYMLTSEDRKLRVGFIVPVNPPTVASAVKALKKVKRRFPEFSTMTTDNDILWRYHKEIEQAVGITIYFCHEYSSWEKGGVENFNGVARRYLKKGSDLSQYSDAYVKKVEATLNDRYMAVLDYQTPQEALDEYRKQQQTEAKPAHKNSQKKEMQCSASGA